MKMTGRKTIKGEKTTAPKAVKAGTSQGKKIATSASSAKPIPTHEEIAKRSFEIYLERGGEHGHDAQDWAQAEAELLGRSA